MENKQNTNERREQDANKAATEKMNSNNEQQAAKQRMNQNKVTKSENPDDDGSSLNNSEEGRSTYPLSAEERNKRKLKTEEDEDFGSEQLQ